MASGSGSEGVYTKDFHRISQAKEELSSARSCPGSTTPWYACGADCGDGDNEDPDPAVAALNLATSFEPVGTTSVRSSRSNKTPQSFPGNPRMVSHYQN